MKIYLKFSKKILKLGSNSVSFFFFNKAKSTAYLFYASSKLFNLLVYFYQFQSYSSILSNNKNKQKWTNDFYNTLELNNFKRIRKLSYLTVYNLTIVKDTKVK